MRESLTARLKRIETVAQAIRLPLTTLANESNVNVRTMQRWFAGHGTPQPNNIEAAERVLAKHVRATYRICRAELLAWGKLRGDEDCGAVTGSPVNDTGAAA